MQVQQILMKHFGDMLLRNSIGSSHVHKYYSSFRKEETLHRMGVRQLMFPMPSPESTQMTGCNPQPHDALKACIRHSSLNNVYSKKQLMGLYILILKCLSTDGLNKRHHKNVIHLSFRSIEYFWVPIATRSLKLKRKIWIKSDSTSDIFSLRLSDRHAWRFILKWISEGKIAFGQINKPSKVQSAILTWLHFPEPWRVPLISVAFPKVTFVSFRFSGYTYAKHEVIKAILGMYTNI